MNSKSDSKNFTVIIRECFEILPRSVQVKAKWVIAVQVVLSVLDLAGVAAIGVLATLSVFGSSGSKPGNRISQLLDILGLSDNSMQFQALVLGLAATLILVTKTILSVYFVKKTYFFLARTSAAISASLVNKVLSQNIDDLNKKSMQKTIYTVTYGVDSIAVGVLGILVSIVSDFSLIAVMILGLFFVDSLMAVITFATFSLLALALYKLLSDRAQELGRRQAQVQVRNSEKIAEVINSYREILVRGRRFNYSQQISRLRFDLADINAERAFIPNISKYVVEISIVVGGMVLSGIQFLLNDAARAIAVLAIFLAASTRIAPALMRLQQSAVGIRSSLGSAMPTLELIKQLKDLDQIKSNQKGFDIWHEGFEPSINLQNAGFKYSGRDNFEISSLNMKIAPGNFVAVVGPTGSGKSTLCDLILGALQPTSGSITVDGLSPLEAISRFPGAIGYVPQEIGITNGSIRENILLGFETSDISDDQIWESLRIAHFDEFVKSLSDELDSKIGDRGTHLSGGQRQRLGIARAILTHPKLLVMDEATSSLDALTESLISKSIQSLKGSTTLIVIAHRLSTVQNADFVYYMDKGTFVGGGTFSQLRAEHPKFEEQAKLMGL